MHPFQLNYPSPPVRRRSRNCLRVDYISDGTPLPRCNLLPLDEQAIWLVEHRPFHLHQAAHFFGLCKNAPSCETCIVYKRRVAYCAVPVRVYADGWYDPYSVWIPDAVCGWRPAYRCDTIDRAAAWVKQHGGALGARYVDRNGRRYRDGFVNNAELPLHLKQPR